MDKELQKLKEQITKAFSLIDISILNNLVLPHGRQRTFTSVDEYIDVAIRRTRNWMQISDMNASTGFEDLEEE
jgi:hypothetical protein